MPGGEQRYQIADGSSVHMSEAAQVRPVMFPVDGRLVAAYLTEFHAGPSDSADSAAFRYIVAADDGRGRRLASWVKPYACSAQKRAVRPKTLSHQPLGMSH